MRVISHQCPRIFAVALVACLGPIRICDAVVFLPPETSDGAVPAATTPRWTDSQVALQADATVGADRGVEQASWNSPSNPGTSSLLKPSANGRGAAEKSTATGQGNKFRLPTMPFARSTRPAPQATTRGRSIAGNALGVPQGRGNLSAAANRNALPPARGRSPLAAAAPRTINTNTAGANQASKAAALLSPSYVNDDTNHHIAMPAAAESGPILTAANQEAASDAASKKITPESAADRLLLSAHEASATAETEGELSQVIETCRRARASQPTPPVARYANELAAWAMNRRGQIKAEQGHTREAMLDFDEAVRLDSECWRALHNRGVLFAQAGEFEKAFDDFNRTIGANSNFAKAYSNRAALFIVAGDVMPALEDYARAIELDPNLAVAHRGRGRACHLLGQLDEAIEHYDAAVQLEPSDAYAVASRADLLTDMGRYAEAAREYERAIERAPEAAYAYRSAAWLLATCPQDDVRNPSSALRLAETAIRLEGKEDSIAFDTLAAAQASGGNYAAATETLNRAIALAADNEREVYQDRLFMYKHGRPYRITPMRSVSQASYQR